MDFKRALDLFVKPHAERNTPADCGYRVVSPMYGAIAGRVVYGQHGSVDFALNDDVAFRGWLHDIRRRSVGFDVSDYFIAAHDAADFALWRGMNGGA